MSKAGFWKKDWFLGLGVTLVLLFAGGSQLIQGLERSAYDWGVRASSRAPSDKVAIIAIDDQSLSNIGRWPWSREVMAKMTDKLAVAKAKLIANTVLFFEPQLDPGLVYVNKLQEIYGRLVPAGTDPNKPPRGLSSELAQIGTTLREAESALNPDRKLAESFEKAGNVLLPIDVAWGEPRGKPDRPLPEFVVKNALPKVSTGEDLPLLTRALQYPIESLGKEAVGLGHLNLWKDIDGTVRSEPLVVAYFDHYFPSLSMMIAARSLNLGVGDIAVQLGEGVRLGKLKITTDSALLMNTYFYKDRDGRPAFQVDSFYDLYSGKIPVDKYRDKIVLIGFTASGQTELPATPISPAMPPVLTLAHAVSSILQEHFFVRPTWGIWVEFLVFVLIAAYLIVLLPRLSAGVGAGATIGVAALLLAAHFVLMTGQGVWLQLMQPLALLVVGRQCAHARPRLPGARPARHGLRLLPQGAAGRHRDGQSLQSRARLRAQAPVQQGRSGVPLHGRLQPEIPGSRGEIVARQADVGNGRPRRRADPPRRHACARRRHREADARSLPGGERARQGLHGRRVSRQGPENRARRGDQDHGAFAGVRGRRARRGQGAFLPRGRDRGAPEPYQYRDHLRRRRRARPVLHRNGTPEGQGPGSVHQAGQYAADREGRVDHGARGRCARLRAQTKRRASGREAGQRHVRT